MTETRSIKIRLTTYRKLKVMAAQAGVTMLEYVDRLVTSAEQAASRADSRAAEQSEAHAAQSDAVNTRPI